MTNPFPKDFLWGASTAAHQVDGGTCNQWTVWEQANAGRLAHTAQTRLGQLPSWALLARDACEPANYISGRGVEHYQRYEADFDVLQQLHLNAYRFSIEWSRLEPREGVWDEPAITHYREYIAQLKRRGIEPVLTLWHWTMPTWFTDKGGFEKRANLKYFERFVAKVVAEYGSELRYVITLNEPSAYVGLGYLSAEWPPQRRNVLLGLRVYRNLRQAHLRSYGIIKRAHPSIAVSVAAHLVDVRPWQPGNGLNRLLVAAARYVSNWWFLNGIQRQLDFIGLNYYFTSYLDWRGRVHNPQVPHNDLGWYMEPGRIGALLEAVWARYHLPIIVTENGLADGADAQRQWWLEQTLTALAAARAHGVDVRGYLHWSLLDNFEWAYGWLGQFGLVAVDRTTMRRTIRPSARWLARYIQQADVPQEMVAK